MAISNKHIDDLCGQQWKGSVCPHGVDHDDKYNVCMGCLEYAMQAES